MLAQAKSPVKPLLHRFLAPAQPKLPWKRIVLAGLGGGIAIAVIALLADTTSLPLLAAAFGSSCVLIFTVPEAPFSQPMNVVGGHFVSAAWGVVIIGIFPVTWWSYALAVGLAITSMVLLRVTHPPAGGDPIAVMLAGAGWTYLVTPILIGAILLVIVGVIFHRLTGVRYP